MLRITESESVESAKSYYSRDDYYGVGESLVGNWIGKGAALLGLSSRVKTGDFHALCENRHPATGRRITAKTRKDRRPGYDFTFDVPKSISVVHALTADQRILEAFYQAIGEAMAVVETEMHVRVRRRGADHDRRTGNLVAVPFTHFTTRPVDGWPDPHLHVHCFVLNMSHDPVEKSWKAGQFGRIKQQAPFYQAVYHGALVRSLARIGYRLVPSGGKHELEGFPPDLIRKFSRRTAEINDTAEERGIVDAEEKAKLGAKLRQSKKGALSGAQLAQKWKSLLSPEEAEYLASLSLGSPAVVLEGVSAAQALDFAIDHVFERRSVVSRSELLTIALKHAAGAVTLSDLEAELSIRHEILAEEVDDEIWLTTKKVLVEEYENIEFVKCTRGSMLPIGSGGRVATGEKLSREQADAIEHILHSLDQVTSVSGGPGTGKTTLMRAAVPAIEATGLKVHVFAQSAEAARKVLRDEGFAEAETVHYLLHNPAIREKVQGQVLWIDEAGLVGAAQMRQIFQLAEKLDCRVILGGDSGQHPPVPRGDALRILEKHAGLKHAKVKTIRRQKSERYRDAVQLISDRNVREGFEVLDDLGWIKELPADQRHQQLANEYVASALKGESVTIVAPTHAEGRRITREVRRTLKKAGQLAAKEHVSACLKNTGWTEAQRADPRNYEPGLVIEFHRNTRRNRFRRGQRVHVCSTSPLRVRDADGNEGELPFDEAGKFSVYQPEPLSLASGDVLRMTGNGRDKSGARICNGSHYRLKAVLSNGDLALANGMVLDRDFGHFSHGYCTTSIAAQGKTIDHVIVGQSGESLGRASSAEQFNVSVSRGRHRVTIFTNDKKRLLKVVQRSSARLAAHDLIPQQRRRAILRDWVMGQASNSRHSALFSRANMKLCPEPKLPTTEPDLSI